MNSVLEILRKEKICWCFATGRIQKRNSGAGINIKEDFISFEDILYFLMQFKDRNIEDDNFKEKKLLTTYS